MNTIDKSKSIGPLGQGVGVRKNDEVKSKSTSKVGSASEELSKQLLKSSVEVDLSARSKERAAAHRKAFEIAQSTPEINEDRVAELRQRIASGQYKADAEKIADGIMREAVMEQLASLPDEPA